MVLISTLGYSQSQQKQQESDTNTVSRYYTATPTAPVRTPPATMDTKNSVQYPVTRIIDGDTVVIMTYQQGKDMNRKFVILRDSMKSQKKTIDTLTQSNGFLLDYLHAVQYKTSELVEANKDLIRTNSVLTQQISTHRDSISAITRRVELDKIRFEMSKSESDFKLDLYKLEMTSKLELYKSDMQTKTELFNAQLELEKRNSTQRARQSAILGGLIVGGIAITGALIGSWMPSSWFK
jgi:hypothetical protein